MSDIDVGSEWVDKETGLEFTVIKSKGFDIEIDLGCGRKASYAPKTFLNRFMPKEQGRKDYSQNIAASILKDAIDAMSERGKSYDTDGKGVERSMDKVVAMFNTLTGHMLTTEQGWDFMILLKLVRSSQGYKHDNYIDESAYFGLAGEAASEANDD